MSEQSRLGLAVVCAAVVLGALGALLFTGNGLGLNLTIWVLALVAAGVVTASRSGAALPSGARWLVAPAVLFALLFAWRDSPTLKLLNGIALAGAICLPLLRAGIDRLRTAYLTDFALGAVLAGAHGSAGTFALLTEVEWRSVARDGWTGNAAAIARGSLIALPVLVVFGSLLASADAVFASYFTTAVAVDTESLVTRAAIGVSVACLAGGLLRGALWGEGPWRARTGRPPALVIGGIEAATVLALLDALFASFVLVQVRYLFGGIALARATPGLTYAEYARSGFFELVTVTALVLPLLLLLHWLVCKDDPRHERWFRCLALAQLALLLPIMASAVQRMRIYQEGYGMTELRFYTVAFMGLIAVLVAWFGATVLRGHRERFASGAIVAGFASVLLLNVVNPDAIVARANVTRIAEGRTFDARYVTGLSADAVPTLIDALEGLPSAERCAVASRLLDESRPEYGGNWESMTLSRARASRLLEAARPGLLDATCTGDSHPE